MRLPSYSRREFSADTRKAAFLRTIDADGIARCQGCTAPLCTGHIEYDHEIPWEISRDSSPDNCQVLCDVCHAAKTYEQDIPLIAAVDRKRARHTGAHRSRHPMPAGRNSGWSKPIGAFRPVRRISQARRHRIMMAKRYELFGGGDDARG